MSEDDMKEQIQLALQSDYPEVNFLRHFIEYEAKLAAAEKDAARYRWLLENKEYPGYVYDALANHKQLDEAIDTAKGE